MMMGYALLMEGVHRGDRRLTDSGLRALDFAVSDPRPAAVKPSVFENLAVAAAYNVARVRLKNVPLFARYRDRWDAWLRAVRVLRIDRPNRFGNKQIVEAAAIVELLRTRLRSMAPGTVLAQRTTARRLVLDFVNRRLPRFAAARSIVCDSGSALVLSDADTEPLAYHALAAGFLARTIELLGTAASPRAREVLAEAARASWLLASPAGDVSYVGRSQEQAWTLSFTAYAATLAATQPGTAADEDGRLRGLADGVLARLRTGYSNGPLGFWITPALAIDSEAGLRALDAYTGAPAYAGLTLAALEWLQEATRRTPDPPPASPVPDPGSVVLSRGNEQIAVVRTDTTWYAVKRAASPDRAPGDLRYSFGLATLERRAGDGWETVVPVRPRTKQSRHDSTGPVLLAGRVRGYPYGERMTLTPDGGVRVRGGFMRSDGVLVRRGVTFRFEPVDEGVRMTFSARRRDRFEVSAFFVSREAPLVSSALEVSDGRQAVRFGRRVSTADPQSGYGSGEEPRLIRSRSILTARDDGGVWVWLGPSRR